MRAHHLAGSIGHSQGQLGGCQQASPLTVRRHPCLYLFLYRMLGAWNPLPTGESFNDTYSDRPSWKILYCERKSATTLALGTSHVQPTNNASLAPKMQSRAPRFTMSHSLSPASSWSAAAPGRIAIALHQQYKQRQRVVRLQSLLSVAVVHGIRLHELLTRSLLIHLLF